MPTSKLRFNIYMAHLIRSKITKTNIFIRITSKQIDLIFSNNNFAFLLFSFKEAHGNQPILKTLKD